MCVPIVSVGGTHRKEHKMSVKKLTIRFQVTTEEHINFEYFLKDLLNVSVLPALNAELVIGSMEVKTARK